jgi:hypothetical protein
MRIHNPAFFLVNLCVCVPRSDCYTSDFFLGCMEVMMVGRQTRAQAARFVDFLNSYHTSGILWSELDPIFPHKREREIAGTGEGWPLGSGVEPSLTQEKQPPAQTAPPLFHVAQLNPLKRGGGILA